MAQTGQFKGVTPRLLPSLIHPDRVHDTDLTDVIAAMAIELGREAFTNQQNAILSRRDSLDLLPTIKCPTLVVGGEQDAITPPDLLMEIATSIIGAQLHIIPLCGHLSVLERPEQVNKLMQDWLGHAAN